MFFCFVLFFKWQSYLWCSSQQTRTLTPPGTLAEGSDQWGGLAEELRRETGTCPQWETESTAADGANSVRTCSTSTIWFSYQIVFKWIVNCGTCRKKYCHTWNVCFSQIKWTSWNQSSAVLFCKNNVVMKKKSLLQLPWPIVVKNLVWSTKTQREKEILAKQTFEKCLIGRILSQL